MGEIFEEVDCSEPIGMVLGFEKLLGQCDLAILPEIRGRDIAAQMILDRFCEALLIAF